MDRKFRPVTVGRATLRHIAIAATTRAQRLHRLFHQGAHVVC